MQTNAQHWHVAVTYPSHHRGDDDRPFEDVDAALENADRAMHRLQGDGLSVAEVEGRDDDKAGIIERYEAAEGKATVAVVEVRPCYRRGCLPPRAPFRSSSALAGRTGSRSAGPIDGDPRLRLRRGSLR
jgi:hypothetical protein